MKRSNKKLNTLFEEEYYWFKKEEMKIQQNQE
jgi:hypothetical protein